MAERNEEVIDKATVEALKKEALDSDVSYDDFAQTLSKVEALRVFQERYGR